MTTVAYSDVAPCSWNRDILHKVTCDVRNDCEASVNGWTSYWGRLPHCSWICSNSVIMLGGIDVSSERGISCSSICTGLITIVEKGTICYRCGRKRFSCCRSCGRCMVPHTFACLLSRLQLVAKFLGRMREKTSSVFKSCSYASLCRHGFHFWASVSHGFKSLFMRESH